jgi:hypothetical protein
VMTAIQTLRNRALEAGSLKSTPQQKVETQPVSLPLTQGAGAPSTAPQQTVVIQPAESNVVYVPQYNPSTVYGAPVAAPQGYTSTGYTGTEMLTTGLVSFGAGMLLGAVINDGDDDWDCDWHGGGGGNVHYNNNVYMNRNVVVPGQGKYTSQYPARLQPQPGRGYPRPMPYQGAGGLSPNGPASRPYNRADARRYAAGNPDVTRPSFPELNTLPNGSDQRVKRGSAENNRPTRAANRPGPPSNRLAANQLQARPQPAQPRNRMASNRPTTPNRADNRMRGFGGGPDSRGGRGGAFGGYESGRLAKAESNRGRASLGGGGRAARADGGNRRGGGGGGRRRR